MFDTQVCQTSLSMQNMNGYNLFLAVYRRGKASQNTQLSLNAKDERMIDEYGRTIRT
jgi:hypothetical protein